jgi:hypothetical protein
MSQANPRDTIKKICQRTLLMAVYNCGGVNKWAPLE